MTDDERRAKAVELIAALIRSGDEQCHMAASSVIAPFLTQDEITLLAWSLFNALPWDTAQGLVEAIVSPAYILPQQSDYLHGARLWAQGATVAERKAYLLTAYKSMPVKEQRKFMEWAKK